MRVITFMLYLGFLLIGGSYSYAGTQSGNNVNLSLQNFAHKKHVKPTIEDQNVLVIEDSDVDFEDDFFANDNFNDNCNTNFLVGKYYLLHTMYSLNSKQFALFDCKKHCKTVPFLRVNWCPIYLSQKVLRI